MEDIQGKVIFNTNFFQVPNGIFDEDIKIMTTERIKRRYRAVERSLKLAEKLVYIYLCRCGNNGGTAFPSYKKIGEKCGISRDTAIKSMNVLIDNGLVVKKSRKIPGTEIQHSNVYEIIWPKQMRNE